MSVLNRKLREFFKTETAGGVFLVGAGLLALILANSGASGALLRPLKYPLTEKPAEFNCEFFCCVFRYD